VPIGSLGKAEAGQGKTVFPTERQAARRSLKYGGKVGSTNSLAIPFSCGEPTHKSALMDFAYKRRAKYPVR